MTNIEKFAGDGLGIILEEPIDAIYTAQTGGMSCHHPETPGSWLPLPYRFQEDYDFESLPFHDDLCWGGFRKYPNPEWPRPSQEKVAKNCDFIDTWLKDIWPEFNIRVDRDRWQEMEEAWIPVLVTDKNAKGILVYPNCD